MPQTFAIDKTRVNAYVKKLLWRQIKIYAIVLLIVALPHIFDSRTTLRSNLMASSIVTAMIAASLFWGFKKNIKALEQMAIIVDDKGIEIKTPMTQYKKIDWDVSAYKEKDNGVIKVYDKTVSSFNRWWSGRGVITIPYEITDRDSMVSQLNIYSGLDIS
ncbi:hypothetical protein [Mucilaginibacter sp.]|uniref:hypothetical protein n=1 Tax=Mucilaginibacter sp. TaxID=1882438 RepID=UPI0025E24D36|nr:hypothetical protein [Mucilaginibacter sp.]